MVPWHAEQDRLPHSWDLSPKHFEHVLSMIEVEGRFYHSLQPAAWHYRQEASPLLDRGFGISKAVSKLREAMLVVEIDMQSIRLAIDLGADSHHSVHQSVTHAAMFWHNLQLLPSLAQADQPGMPAGHACITKKMAAPPGVSWQQAWVVLLCSLGRGSEGI